MVGFLDHSPRLEQIGRPFCEASHISPVFLCGMVVRNGLVTSGLVTTGFREAGLGKTRRWASNCSHGEREAAKNHGYRCWLRLWKKSLARNSARCPSIERSGP